MQSRFKLRYVAALLIVAVGFALIWHLSRPGTRSPAPSARFHGFTNGFPNEFAPGSLGSLLPSQVERRQQWFAAGTNAALFAISNHLSVHMSVGRNPRFYIQGDAQPTKQTSLLSTRRNFTGVEIPSGEVRICKVAILPHSGPWRIEFGYLAYDQRPAGLATLPQDFVSGIIRRSWRHRVGSVSSEWIEP